MSGEDDDAVARAKTIHNERTKLTAGYVNTVAGSVFTVGGLAPIFAALYTTTTSTIPIGVVLGIAGVCWLASAALHAAARRYLRELK